LLVDVVEVNGEIARRRLGWGEAEQRAECRKQRDGKDFHNKEHLISALCTLLSALTFRG